METALALEAPAVEVRERLAEFVSRWRSGCRSAAAESAALRARLDRAGGRKSLQPTLFRLEETPARYESLQQFLAIRPGIRRCWCGPAPSGWRRDRRLCLGGRDTGIVKDGKHSPGVKRQYSGTLGKIGNCQITVSVQRWRGHLPLGWRLYLPEEWWRPRAAGRAKIRTRSASRRSRSSPSAL